MKFKLIVLSLILIITCSSSFAQDDCPFKGKWKSNAEATKKEMEKNNKYTTKLREEISEKIHGKLILEYTCTEVTANHDHQIQRYNYKILRRNGNMLTVQYIDKEDIEQINEEKIYLNGDCYSGGYESLGYNEVFCRTN